MFEKDGAKGMAIEQSTMVCVSNVVCNVVFGHRFNFDDKRFTHLMDILARLTQLNLLVGAISFFPMAKYLPFDPFRMKQFTETIKQFKAFVSEEIDSHEKTFNEDDLRDFTDAFILERRSKTGETDEIFSCKICFIICIC